MSDSRVAGGMDRLPWLSDEPVLVTAPTGRGWDVTGWAVSALLIVAGCLILAWQSEADP